MRRFRYILISLITIFALIFMHRGGILAVPENFIFAILEPIGKVFNISAGSGKSVFSNFSNIKNLQKENAELKDRLSQMEAEIVKLEEFRKENESLKKDLDFKTTSNFETLTATVFAYDPLSVRQLLTIDKGEKDGIRKGMVVMSEGILVGKVQEVFSSSSKVFLVTDPTSAVPSIVHNSTASGILKGQIGFGLALEKIPQNDILKEGQLVLSSGLGGDYPKGILIGKIEKIEKNENDVFQKAIVRPDIKLNRLERVMIITK